MAIASLFADLLRQARPRNPSITIFRAFPLSLRQPSRPLSSGLTNSQGLAVEEESAALVDDLRSQIFQLRFPKRSSIDALDRWVREGRTVTASELREITKDLRKLKRFKHTLELSLLSPLLLNHLYQIGLESNINAIPLDVMVFQFQLVGFQKDAGKDVTIGFQIGGSSAYGFTNLKYSRVEIDEVRRNRCETASLSYSPSPPPAGGCCFERVGGPCDRDREGQQPAGSPGILSAGTPLSPGLRPCRKRTVPAQGVLLGAPSPGPNIQEALGKMIK
ncbi:hypothetical protein ZIOFF_001983 [Zingiber officinale]|uniref:Uncharacterized protein n=1 Tax=Zingiber officinale TaxID=94328 RepID=A0A8J5HZB3_ZINOF|nr:hypothetical protein ZIOFF_001983 [Zingiber officinale]